MKKKTAIITYHRALNYGAILQAYALQKTLERLDRDVSIIDYACPYIEAVYRPYDGSHCASISGKIKKFLKSPQLKKKRIQFDAFGKQFLNLTERFTEKKELKDLNQSFDCFITGSDQVFNPDASHGDWSYFLDFALVEKNIYAYGASFGYDSIPKSYQFKAQKLLERFDAITVREKTGEGIVHDLVGKKAFTVLDPTLLLTAEDWNYIARTPIGTPDNYILVYMMEGCINVVDKARQLAQQYNCKLVLVNPTLRQQQECRDFVQYTSISPQEFVGLFKGARQIVTNSFHGVAFSLVYQKPFYCETSNAQKSSRITDLLNALNIAGRLLPHETDGEIPLSAVSSKLKQLQEQSINRLKDMI